MSDRAQWDLQDLRDQHRQLEQRFFASNREIARLEAELARSEEALAAMTEDRNLWQSEHESDCPNTALVEELRIELAKAEEERRLAQLEIAEAKESECPDCHYLREKHCKGIGLTEEQENQYIPCEYCSLKAQLSQAQQRVRELEWKLGIV